MRLHREKESGEARTNEPTDDASVTEVSGIKLALTRGSDTASPLSNLVPLICLQVSYSAVPCFLFSSLSLPLSLLFSSCSAYRCTHQPAHPRTSFPITKVKREKRKRDNRLTVGFIPIQPLLTVTSLFFLSFSSSLYANCFTLLLLYSLLSN